MSRDGVIESIRLTLEELNKSFVILREVAFDLRLQLHECDAWRHVERAACEVSLAAHLLKLSESLGGE